MPSTPITSPPSTTSPASSCNRAGGRSRWASTSRSAIRPWSCSRRSSSPPPRRRSRRFAAVKAVGTLVGTGVSALFLFAIALANLFVLRAVYRTFARVKRGGRYAEADLDGLRAQSGLLGRLFRPPFRLIRATLHMYRLALLFALGCDTSRQ